MSHLLFVRHAYPDIQPDVPAKRWRLGDEERQQSLLVAEQLRPYAPGIVVTSEEPKAAETGQIVAKALNLPCHSAPGLHENDRTGAPYFAHLADFEVMVKTFFETPNERVFGNESADEARRRFATAVGKALEPHPTQTVLLVAHGTVNTLLVAASNPVVSFDLRKAWPLGGFPVLSRPKFRLFERPDVKR